MQIGPQSLIRLSRGRGSPRCSKYMQACHRASSCFPACTMPLCSCHSLQIPCMLLGAFLTIKSRLKPPQSCFLEKIFKHHKCQESLSERASRLGIPASVNRTLSNKALQSILCWSGPGFLKRTGLVHNQLEVRPVVQHKHCGTLPEKVDDSSSWSVTQAIPLSQLQRRRRET